MRVLDGSWRSWERTEACSVTVGVLDGVHRGHRSLLARLIAEDLTPTVVTFEPHPVEVLAPGTSPRLITTIGERVTLLERAGVEQVAILDLGEVRDLTPDAFVSDILLERLSMKSIVAGVDFQFGKNRTGNVALLTEMGPKHGFEVSVVDLVIENGTVSSSRIRALIEAGDVRSARLLLDSGFTTSNVVMKGDGRGRDIGFPTANIEPPDRKVIPADGVYAALASVGGRVAKAAVNVGVRPTFGAGERLIEAHILDFDEDIYGDQITIEFVERLRDELRFDSVEALVEQMHRDVQQTRDLLSVDP